MNLNRCTEFRVATLMAAALSRTVSFRNPGNWRCVPGSFEATSFPNREDPASPLKQSCVE